jgi:hypothetical protein
VVESRRRRGGSVAAHPRLERRHGGARVWGELGGAVAAEGECEGAAVAKKGGAASACGSPVQQMPRIPRVHCSSPKLGLGRASRGV